MWKKPRHPPGGWRVKTSSDVKKSDLLNVWFHTCPVNLMSQEHLEGVYSHCNKHPPGLLVQRSTMAFVNTFSNDVCYDETILHITKC